ncbi:UbiA family prenyltransferase [Streptomyces nigrescens]
MSVEPVRAGRAAGARPAELPQISPPAGAARSRLRHTLRAHVQTWRPYTLAYPGIVGLAGAAAGGGPATNAGLIAAAVAAPMASWLGGHYLGDYYDRDLDAISKAQRPIPSGRLSPRSARACGIVAVLAAGGITLVANWPVVVAVLVAGIGIVAYSRLLKRHGIWGNAVRGLLTALAVLYGAAVVAPLGEPPSWRIVPLAMVALLHDTATNLVGTLRDIDGDRAGGYRTLPVQHGPRYTARTATVLYIAALLLAAGAATVAARPEASLFLLLVAAGMGVKAFRPLLTSGAQLTGQAALRGHEVLVGERLVLAAAVLAGTWGPIPALTVLLPVLSVSLATQHRMRAKHELPSTPKVGGI